MGQSHGFIRIAEGPDVAAGTEDLLAYDGQAFVEFCPNGRLDPASAGEGGAEIGYAAAGDDLPRKPCSLQSICAC